MSDNVLGHWHQRIENFQSSSQDFYERVKQQIAARAYPSINYSTVPHREGGAFTAKRDYLRIVYQDLNFELCAAPFGVDFFVSWWLLAKPGCGCLGLLGPVALLIRRKTYFEEDTAIIFREAVHDAVVTVLGELLGDQGGTAPLKFAPPSIAKSPLI
jgi:hypothetical protein